MVIWVVPVRIGQCDRLCDWSFQHTLVILVCGISWRLALLLVLKHWVLLLLIALCTHIAWKQTLSQVLVSILIYLRVADILSWWSHSRKAGWITDLPLIISFEQVADHSLLLEIFLVELNHCLFHDRHLTSVSDLFLLLLSHTFSDDSLWLSTILRLLWVGSCHCFEFSWLRHRISYTDHILSAWLSTVFIIIICAIVTLNSSSGINS